METETVSCALAPLAREFKSYYVVWKRYDTHGEKNPM